jgi:hypothetical protein
MKPGLSSVTLALSSYQKHLTQPDRIYVERKNSSVFIRKMRQRADLPGMALDAFNVENPVFIAYARRTGSGKLRIYIPEVLGKHSLRHMKL